MQNMSYRDKMVILVISIIVILVAGFFALIRPKYNSLVADTATYESTKAEWDGIKAKIDAIPTLKDDITATYNASKKVAQQFVNESMQEVNDNYRIEKQNYKFDQSVQEMIDECELEVSSFSLTDPGEGAIQYHYVMPRVASYALLQSADINGNFAEKVEKLREKAAYTSGLSTVGVLSSSLSLNVTGTKENLMKFLDLIKDSTEAVNVNALEIPDYQFTGGIETTTTDAEGNPVVSIDPNAEGTCDLAVTITFYNAKEIDKPELGD